MTEAQEMLAEGFTVLLETNGEPVKHKATGKEIMVVVDRNPNNLEMLDGGYRDSDRCSIEGRNEDFPSRPAIHDFWIVDGKEFKAMSIRPTPFTTLINLELPD